MKLTAICIILGILVLQNTSVSSISPECLSDIKCGVTSFLKRWQDEIMGKKSNNSDGHGLLQHLLKLPAIWTSTNTVSSTAKADVHKRNDPPPATDNCIRTAEDLVTFLSSSGSVADSSPTKMRSAVVLLVSIHGSVSLPQVAVVNLIGKFAATPQLFSALSQLEVNVLLMVTGTTAAAAAANPCASKALPTAKVRVNFLHGLFTLSPGVLYRVPKSVLVPVLGTIASPDVLDALQPQDTVKIITVLSLSRSLFNCMPLPALHSLLTFVAARSPQEMLTSLPPSTLFGFLDGLLDTVRDAPAFLADDTAHAPALAAVLGSMMTPRMVSVLPASTLDLLFTVIGSSAELAKSLPTSGFVSAFGTLTKSPALLSSLNPNHVAKIIVTVMSDPSLSTSMPSTTIFPLLEAMCVYLPSAFEYFSSADVQMSSSSWCLSLPGLK